LAHESGMILCYYVLLQGSTPIMLPHTHALPWMPLGELMLLSQSF